MEDIMEYVINTPDHQLLTDQGDDLAHDYKVNFQPLSVQDDLFNTAIATFANSTSVTALVEDIFEVWTTQDKDFIGLFLGLPLSWGVVMGLVKLSADHYYEDRDRTNAWCCGRYTTSLTCGATYFMAIGAGLGSLLTATDEAYISVNQHLYTFASSFFISPFMYYAVPVVHDTVPLIPKLAKQYLSQKLGVKPDAMEMQNHV